MNINDVRHEVQLKLTGGILNLELDDTTLNQIINSSLRELQRYICSTKIMTIPFNYCIDLSTYNVSSVTKVYRATGIGSEGINDSAITDPLSIMQWQLLSGSGNVYNFQNYAYDYMAWNTAMQIRNTTSTDLAFKFDKSTNKLYINVANNAPNTITIEYIPEYTDVSQITSGYWLDILVRYSVAMAKTIVGRVRSRYTQSNALWANDGQQMLDEGNSELSALRETMEKNANLWFPID